MKRHLNIPIATIMLVGVLVAGAQAQTSTAQKVVANIPFTSMFVKQNYRPGNTRLQS
jgi:hypothetical protein